MPLLIGIFTPSIGSDSQMEPLGQPGKFQKNTPAQHSSNKND